MMRSAALLLLALAPLPAAGQEMLACEPAFHCSDVTCFGSDPTILAGETGDYVRNPMGPAPEIYVGDGLWVRSSPAVEQQGTLRWLGTTEQGETVMLTVNRRGGDYIYVRRGPGADGRVWIAAGSCG